jgi:hypothetical protein
MAEAFLRILIHTLLHTYTHIYIHTYLHTYIHVHTYIYTYIRPDKGCFLQPKHVAAIGFAVIKVVCRDSFIVGCSAGTAGMSRLKIYVFSASRLHKCKLTLHAIKACENRSY